MPTPQDIRSLHQLYVQLTGLDIRLDMAREHEWFQWVKRGFTSQDLRDMVTHLRAEIRAGRRLPGSLKFRNLIVNLDYFEEDLAEARALARVKAPPLGGRASVLRATGRPAAPPSPPARSAGDILAAQKALEEFLKLKDSL